MSTKEKRLTNELTLVGILESISDIVERGTKGTEIITVRIKQPGAYENVFDIEFMNDKIDDVLEFDDQLGVQLRIRASLNGRLWQPKLADGSPDFASEKKLFLSIVGWSIKLDDEPVATKDRSKRRAARGGKAKEETSDSGMPGDNEMPTPDSAKSQKRQERDAKKPQPEEEAKMKKDNDLPY